MPLQLADRLALPDQAWKWTFADLAIKGAGKTYAASVLAEEFIKAGIPIVAFDALGIWWGLRAGIDNNPGLPVVVFGGDHRDKPIPTKQDMGKLIVDEVRLRLMVKAILVSRMSCVIDTSEFSKGMRRRIIAIFTTELYKLNRSYGPRHVFLEEADEWIPQRLHGKDEWAASCFGAVDDLVRKGGNFLLGCTLITQRSAVLSKDVLTQCNCLIVLRTLHKLDKKAVETWVESAANPDDAGIAKWYDSLRSLKDGEAWIWHPEEPKIFEKIKFRKRETLHATREYFEQNEFKQKDLAMQDVGEFLARYKEVFEPIKPETKIQKEPGRIESPPIVAISKEPGRIYTASHSETRTIEQILPTIRIEQYRPNVRLGVDLPNEPSTILGKVCVILKDGPAPGNRNDQWNAKSIRERIEDHAWDPQGIEDAIDQLIRWEILSRRNNYLRFDPSRVEKIDRGATLPLS